MPWLELQEPIEFGSIRVWDFYKEGPARIVDSQEMLWLAQLMSGFKGANDKEKQRIGIIQNGDVAFSCQGMEDNSKIRWAANAIGFAFLTGVLASQIKRFPEIAFLGSSEQFSAMSVVLDLDGGVYHTDDYKNVDRYSNMEHHRPLFREPPQMSDKFNSPDRLLLKGLASINDNDFASPLWRRLAVCFEWFMMAWTTSPDVSHPARFIALMTSFEALVKEGREDAVTMGLNAVEICGWTALAKTEYYQKKENKSINDIPTNKPHKFVIDYAKLRNSLVHGDLVRYGWIRHAVGKHKFEPRLVMSFVIYSIVLNFLMDENVFDEFEAAAARSRIDKIINLLHWDTNDSIGTSLSFPS
jgi:hypothetical protein